MVLTLLLQTEQQHLQSGWCFSPAALVQHELLVLVIPILILMTYKMGTVLTCIIQEALPYIETLNFWFQAIPIQQR